MAVLVHGYEIRELPSEVIGYARVSTRQQSADRQVADLLSAGV